MPRAVTLPSSRYPQMLWVLMAFLAKNAVRAASSAARVMLNDAQMRALFINLKPRCGLAGDGESPLSGADATCPQDNGDCRWRNASGKALGDNRGDGTVSPGYAMLSVPTLWTVFVINFLALGLIWAYIVDSYPSFTAARFWGGSAFAAAIGAALAMLRFTVTDSLLPLIGAGTVLVFASALAAMGIRKFFDQKVEWRGAVLVTGLTCVGLFLFAYGYDSMQMRISIYSIAQTVPLLLSLKFLLTPQDGRVSPGARLAGVVAVLITTIYGLRLVAGLLRVGGDFSFVQFNQLQSGLILLLEGGRDAATGCR